MSMDKNKREPLSSPHCQYLLYITCSRYTTCVDVDVVEIGNDDEGRLINFWLKSQERQGKEGIAQVGTNQKQNLQIRLPVSVGTIPSSQSQCHNRAYKLQDAQCSPIQSNDSNKQKCVMSNKKKFSTIVVCRIIGRNLFCSYFTELMWSCVKKNLICASYLVIKVSVSPTTKWEWSDTDNSPHEWSHDNICTYELN